MASARYIKVLWKNSMIDEPIRVFSELDSENWETRKVEIYRDGSQGYADQTRECRSMGLGQIPFPPNEVIAAQPEFEIWDITREEFETEWQSALAGHN